LGPRGSEFLQDFGTDQLKHRGVGAVALTPAGMNDASVPPAALGIALGHVVEQLLHRRRGEHVTGGLATRMEVPALAQSDHLLHHRARRLRLSYRGFDSLINDEGRHQVSHKGAAMRGVAAQLPACITMAHLLLSVEASRGW